MGSRENGREGEAPWQDPNSRRRRRRNLRNEVITSFFVSNYPEGVSESQLRQVFFPFWKLRDAFIRKKKDCFGCVFAFIRYANVENMEELDANLKQVVINNLRVSVNIAKYERSGKANSNVRSGGA